MPDVVIEVGLDIPFPLLNLAKWKRAGGTLGVLGVFSFGYLR
jgi:hypothetical protein